MNDPGLDDPIDESAAKVEQENDERDFIKVEEEDEQTFLKPRYAVKLKTGLLELTCLKPVVVRFDGLSLARGMVSQKWMIKTQLRNKSGYFRSHGHLLQCLCSGAELEGVDTSRRQ